MNKRAIRPNTDTKCQDLHVTKVVGKIKLSCSFNCLRLKQAYLQREKQNLTEFSNLSQIRQFLSNNAVDRFFAFYCFCCAGLFMNMFMNINFCQYFTNNL